MKDIKKNRESKKWSKVILFKRVLWAAIYPFFRYSPRLLWGWRSLILRLFGAKIGKHVHIYPTVRIAMPWNITIEDYSAIGDRVILYALGPIHIQKYVTISQNSHLCAGNHDYSKPDMPLLKEKIHIHDEVWVCADCFIGPGVSVLKKSIVGARAVVTKNVPESVLVVGNPAKIKKNL